MHDSATILYTFPSRRGVMLSFPTPSGLFKVSLLVLITAFAAIARGDLVTACQSPACQSSPNWHSRQHLTNCFGPMISPMQASMSPMWISAQIPPAWWQTHPPQSGSTDQPKGIDLDLRRRRRRPGRGFQTQCHRLGDRRGRQPHTGGNSNKSGFPPNP